MELKDRDIAISIERYVAFARRHKRIDHDSIERTVDLFGYLSQDDLVVKFSLLGFDNRVDGLTRSSISPSRRHGKFDPYKSRVMGHFDFKP